MRKLDLKNSKQAFTLIELMVVVAIMGILAAAGIGAAGSGAQSAQVREEVMMVRSALEFASAETRKMREDHSVAFSESAVKVYRDTACGVNLVHQYELNTPWKLKVDGAPSVASGGVDYRTAACVRFNSRIIGVNPVATSGWLKIAADNGSADAVVVKKDTDNRFLSYFRPKGTGNWQAY